MMNQTSSNDTVVYATFIQRLCAFIVDHLVFVPLNIFFNFNILAIKSLALGVLISIIWWIYKPVMEWKYGATLGKMVLKIRVVDEDLQAISFNQAALRFLPYFAISLSILFSTFALFGLDGFYEAYTFEAFQELDHTIPSINTTQLTFFFFIFSCSSIMLDEKKQSIHDRFSRTYCIITKEKDTSSTKKTLD
jgi:uncharacterized RDD family membrane protein YckC